MYWNNLLYISNKSQHFELAYEGRVDDLEAGIEASVREADSAGNARCSPEGIVSVRPRPADGGVALRALVWLVARRASAPALVSSVGGSFEYQRRRSLRVEDTDRLA